MYFRVMGKLNARRNGLLSEEEKGFTLIELLVVVIIIGILAAIAIPVYLSVQGNAKNSAAQSDATNLKTAIASIQTNDGALPDGIDWKDNTGVSAAPAFTSSTATITPTDTWKSAGASFGNDTQELKYTPASDGSSYTICVEATTGKYFSANDSSGVTASSGSCMGASS